MGGKEVSYKMIEKIYKEDENYMEKKTSRKYDLVDLLMIGGYSLIISLSGASAGLGLGWLIWCK